MDFEKLADELDFFNDEFDDNLAVADAFADFVREHMKYDDNITSLCIRVISYLSTIAKSQGGHKGLHALSIHMEALAKPFGNFAREGLPEYIPSNKSDKLTIVSD